MSNFAEDAPSYPDPAMNILTSNLLAAPSNGIITTRASEWRNRTHVIPLRRRSRGFRGSAELPWSCHERSSSHERSTGSAIKRDSHNTAKVKWMAKQMDSCCPTSQKMEGLESAELPCSCHECSHERLGAIQHDTAITSGERSKRKRIANKWYSMKNFIRLQYNNDN